MSLLNLPQPDGSLSPYRTIGQPVAPQKGLRFSQRIAWRLAR